MLLSDTSPYKDNVTEAGTFAGNEHLTDTNKAFPLSYSSSYFFPFNSLVKCPSVYL